MKKIKDCVVVASFVQFLAITLIVGSIYSQTRQMDAADLQLAVNKLSVLGSVLYVAAHPDDENTALLSYFAKGKLYRTGYLSITRGEGGQNLIGAEQGTELGLIRTQELLAARKIDGAEQFFTRAIDFGYSKSSEEALRLWNKDSVLKDVVWVIRTFRPDIIITRFSPTQGGHGHHLASAVLAEEAFKISGDANVFPEQLSHVKLWKAKRLIFNHFRFGRRLPTGSLTDSLSGTNSNQSNTQTIKVDVGEYNPLLGKSYTEIAGISRTMHKSQGMGSPQNKGSNVNEFVVTAGDSAAVDFFDGVDISWNRIPNGKKIAQLTADIRKNFLPSTPEKSIPSLLKLYRALLKINNDPLIDGKIKEIESLIQSCAGLWIEACPTMSFRRAKANNAAYTRNDSIGITVTLLNRSSATIIVSSVSSPQLNINTPARLNDQPDLPDYAIQAGKAALAGVVGQAKQLLKYNEPYQMQFSALIRSNELYSQPYWLISNPKNNRYAVDDQTAIGRPESPASLFVTVSLAIENELMMFTVPVQYKWIDDTEGEKLRSVEILPAVSVGLAEKNIIVVSDSVSKTVNVKVRANADNLSGVMRLNIPDGWKYSPAEQKFLFGKKGEEVSLQFSISTKRNSHGGFFFAEATVNGIAYSSEVKTIRYPHILPQTLLEKAEGKLVKLDLQKKGVIVGYIMGAGDQVPFALQQMGFTVSLISNDELRSGNLARYDAIVAGIRAYNTQEQLRISNSQLMKYVEQGGTYIVQYQTAAKGETDNIAPYPMTISRDRVTDEHAAMNFVKPNHPLLNYPNKISAKDFEGWVQERGLYFANKWDEKFETILSCADPNEQALEGSLLAAKYGKGNYIFTGLAFFRQLPAGVEGAYRLFANLISAGK